MSDITKRFCRFNTAGWLGLIPNPIINTNEAWFLTNTEKVHALFCKLMEVIDTVNTYSELMKQLADILDDFEETVKEEVEKYIKELFESGQLDDKIRDFILERATYLANPIISGGCEIRGVEEKVFDTGCDRYGAETNTTIQYSWTQGSTFFTKNGVEYMACCLTSLNCETNEVEIAIFKRGKNASVGHTTAILGHANGLCFNPNNNCLYVAHSSMYQNPRETVGNHNGWSNRVATRVPDFRVTEVQLVFNTDGTVSLIVNSNSKTSPVCFYDMEYNNNKLYGYVKDTKKVYEYDFANNNAFEVANLYPLWSRGMYSGTEGCFSMNDKYFAICTYDNQTVWIIPRASAVNGYDTNNYPTRAINLPQVYENQHCLGEVEGITLSSNNYLRILANQYMQTPSYSAYIQSSWGYTRIDSNTSQSKSLGISRNQTQKVIYVDTQLRDSNGGFDNIINADGTLARPYRYLQQAINRVNWDNTISNAIIYVHGNFSGLVTYCYGTKPIEIVGCVQIVGTTYSTPLTASQYVPANNVALSNKPYYGSFYFRKCPFVKISYFRGSNPTSVVTNEAQMPFSFTDCSRVQVEGCVANVVATDANIDAPTDSQGNKISYHTNNSNVSFYDDTDAIAHCTGECHATTGSLVYARNNDVTFKNSSSVVLD